MNKNINIINTINNNIDDIKLSEWSLEWLKKKEKHLKASTYANYEYYIGHYIVPNLGNLSLTDINGDILQEFLLYLAHNGGKKTGLAVKTCHHIISLLLLVLKDAEKRNLMALGEFDLYYPSKTNQELPVFSYEHEEQICKEIISNLSLKKLGILVALYSGIRIGELCALKWEDIDLKNGIMTIHHTIQRIYHISNDNHGKTDLQISSPKTGNSYREIPICNFLIPLLKQYQNNQHYYFLTASEKPTEPRNYRLFYKYFLHSINVPYLKFHALRHTFATKCVDAGCDYKTLSTILGHASVHTTLDLYVHPRMEQKKKCIETMFNNSCINQIINMV